MNIKGFFSRQNAFLWMVIGLFALTILCVNPIRETPMEDDWAYSLTVRHLLDTGQYQLHDWAAANMPFQIYWGGLFARFLGYSFSSLRISTLFLALFGLVAFNFLAREHGLDDTQAGLLMLGLLASPLVLRFSFNFMTDVPFLACLIIALFFYTRAVRLHSYPLMLLASIAASAAILTRQFGVALIAGVFFIWALGKEHRQQALFFLAGLALPVVAALWQFSAGIFNPNWAARYTVHVQSQYFANTSVMMTNLLWRPTVILQYLALFSMPFVLLMLLSSVLTLLPSVLSAFWSLDDRIRRLLMIALALVGFAMSVFAVTADWLGIGNPSGFGKGQSLILVCGISLLLISWYLLRSSRNLNVPFHFPNSKSLKLDIALLVVFVIYILAGMLYGRFANNLSLFMPYLPWNFSILKNMDGLDRAILTFFTSIGAVLFARIFALRYCNDPGWRKLPPHEQLLDFVTLFLLLLQIIFFQLGDEYILIFLPFTLIVVGRHLRNWLNRLSIVTALTCLVMLATSAVWTRGLLSLAEASWQGAEFVRTNGTPPSQISGPMQWVQYYKFQDYLADAKDVPFDKAVRDIFYRWYPEQQERAQFWVTESLDAPADENWEVLIEIPYRDVFLQEMRIFVVKRDGKK